MRLRGVRLEPYFQRYMDTRPLAPARGELFTRPDSATSTEQFFAALNTDEQAEILDWLLEIAAAIHSGSGIESSINVAPAIVSTERGRNDFLYLAASATTPITFEFSELPTDWTEVEANRLFTLIRERGHQSAFDNFGKGDIDLEAMTALSFDTIKITGGVTVGFDRDTESQNRLERIYRAITDAGKQHVVQGVEAQSAFEWLKRVGYTTFQGYWFGIPTPAVQLAHRA
jgi:EAL domain-containing protein (putative c-di-GMP-specific phosphodiesterase class I)